MGPILVEAERPTAGSRLRRRPQPQFRPQVKRVLPFLDGVAARAGLYAFHVLYAVFFTTDFTESRRRFAMNGTHHIQIPLSQSSSSVTLEARQDAFQIDDAERCRCRVAPPAEPRPSASSIAATVHWQS